MLECYKIIHGIVRSECHDVLALSENRTRGYHCKLTNLLPTARLNVRTHYFTERVSKWNALPAEVVQQLTYSQFKCSLRKHLAIT